MRSSSSSSTSSKRRRRLLLWRRSRRRLGEACTGLGGRLVPLRGDLDEGPDDGGALLVVPARRLDVVAALGEHARGEPVAQARVVALDGRRGGREACLALGVVAVAEVRVRGGCGGTQGAVLRAQTREVAVRRERAAKVPDDLALARAVHEALHAADRARDGRDGRVRVRVAKVLRGRAHLERRGRDRLHRRHLPLDRARHALHVLGNALELLSKHTHTHQREQRENSNVVQMDKQAQRRRGMPRGPRLGRQGARGRGARGAAGWGRGWGSRAAWWVPWSSSTWCVRPHGSGAATQSAAVAACPGQQGLWPRGARTSGSWRAWLAGTVCLQLSWSW